MKEEFKYYKENNIYYIPRDIYEECRKQKLEFETTPKIIEDKNMYSIPEELWKDFLTRNRINGIEQKEKESFIIAYKDGLTGNIYIPEKYHIETSANTRLVLNKKCSSTTERQLEKILNKKIYVITVYTRPTPIETVILARLKDKLFISNEDANKYGLNKKDREIIKIGNEIYYLVTKEEITLLEIISSKSGLKLSIIEKEIIPKER